MKREGYTLIELLIVVLMVAIIPAIVVGMTIWTDRNIDYALTLWKGHAVNCPYWLSFLATVVGNAFTLIFNVAMEIVRIAK